MSDEFKLSETAVHSASNPPESGSAGVPQPPGIPGVVPLLPLMDLNLFPRMIQPMLISEESLMTAIQETILHGRVISLFNFRGEPTQLADLGADALHPIGMSAYVLKMNKDDGGPMRVLVQGIERIHLVEIASLAPYPIARIEPATDRLEVTRQVEALVASVRSLFKKVLELAPGMPAELGMMNQSVEQPGLLADIVASALSLKREDRQEVLSTLDVEKRLELVILLLERQIEILELGSKIQNQIKGKIDKNQRDYYLREQIKAIHEELGDKDETAAEADDLAGRLEKKELPEEARGAAFKELNRVRRMNPASAEYNVSRTYLDWFLDLPWNEATEDNRDINRAQAILDEDHYGLEKIKRRIIEYLAVHKLKPDMKGPILCFVGPPGTGKTSLGRSIARALGRKFVRISLGGVRDEAEIRGHRRTYVGALPGRIIQGLKRAGTRNPVFMLDEIDKLGQDFRGDPSSALLEVLDPEQNHSFSDHYLEVAYDLSKVLFIATANVLDTIPGPLRDRMEIIGLSGYTDEEKIRIAKKYLVPRQREANGLKAGQITFRDTALRRIIADYTREAGLRNLEREIGSIARHVATQVAKEEVEKAVIGPPEVARILGPAKFESEVKARTAPAGVATGLAWTMAGGDILFIEATAMPGKGGLTLTGQLGDVMKESATAALSWVRSRSSELNIPEDYFSRHDLHIHLPAGAIPKDGPSAGVTLTTALVSLVTGRRVRPDVAMTGEISLRGLVLPVGGIKEKVLAAKRAGLKEILLPKRNQRDFHEISEHLTAGLTIHFVEKMDEVLRLALKD